MRSRLCLSVIGLALGLAACGSSGSQMDRVSFVVSAGRVGGLPASPGTSYTHTTRYFVRAGLHGSPSYSGALCGLRFATIGLSVTFFNLGGGRSTPRSCDFFGGAEATSPRWHTANGLRVGAPLVTLHRLFPKARKVGKGRVWHSAIPADSTQWLLKDPAPGTVAARTILEAWVNGGRVVALGSETVGH
jgi:hypothetical protein